jgi:hypothetical protein
MPIQKLMLDRKDTEYLEEEDEYASEEDVDVSHTGYGTEVDRKWTISEPNWGWPRSGPK